jgi:hypothetical protein
MYVRGLFSTLLSILSANPGSSHGVFCVLISIFLFFPAAAGFSESIRSGNSREVCRKTISSTLSSLLADSAQAEDSVVLSETYAKKSRQREAQEEVKMKAINKKLEGNDFTPDTMAQQNLIATSIKLYHTQMLDSLDQLEQAKKKKIEVSTHLAKLRKKVEQIFTITMNEDPEGSNRKIFNTIEWRSLCPKYRVLCPLPAEHLLILVSITDEIDDVDQGCLHYSKLR